ncbi:ABC transporter permease [Bacillus pinisoli]|uniref:ABC transporter permease n=1 Tax=Bacillus pinisoli TaxID=2901866 RepID=UPI001FF606B7|nr:ABC transporter permease subunit [Bacillus pinisoli]
MFKKILYNWFFLFFILLFVVPVMYLLIRSITIGWRWESFDFISINIDGWTELLGNYDINRAILTSVTISLVVILLNVIISLPAAKELAFRDFKGKAFVDTILQLPILFPSLAMVMGIHITMIKLGLTDHWIGVSLVHLIPTVPYSIRIFRAAFEHLGPHLELQAISLGASKRRVFYHIYFPLLLPSVRSVIFLTTVISLSQYALTAIIGGGNVMTLAMIYFPYLSTVNENLIASFSLLFGIIPFLVLLVIEILIQLLIPYRKSLFY